jgi:phosphotransferase system IIB component
MSAEMLTIIIAAVVIVALIVIAIIIRHKHVKDNGKISSKNHEAYVDKNIDKVINGLGGKKNIISLTASISKIKFIVNDVRIVNKEQLREFGATGFIESSNSITCIFGKLSKHLAEEITAYIEKK